MLKTLIIISVFGAFSALLSTILGYHYTDLMHWVIAAPIILIGLWVGSRG